MLFDLDDLILRKAQARKEAAERVERIRAERAQSDFDGCLYFLQLHPDQEYRLRDREVVDRLVALGLEARLEKWWTYAVSAGPRAWVVTVPDSK